MQKCNMIVLFSLQYEPPLIVSILRIHVKRPPGPRPQDQTPVHCRMKKGLTTGHGIHSGSFAGNCQRRGIGGDMHVYQWAAGGLSLGTRGKEAERKPELPSKCVPKLELGNEGGIQDLKISAIVFAVSIRSPQFKSVLLSAD